MTGPSSPGDAAWRPDARFDDPGELSRTLLRRILPLVSNPGRYIGGETGTRREGFTPGGANVLLAFPDAYEVGMSHQGLRILYSLLNRLPRTYCDLAFTPWPDMEQRMRSEGLPLFGLESRRPAGRFDLVGFSLGYELAYTNMLTMIDLSGAPLLAADRTEDHPIFLAGGSCVLNPAVVGPFLDVVFLGDGEEIIQEAAAVVADGKQAGRDRAALLERVRALPGAWHRGGREPVRARVIHDLNAFPPPDPIVPVIEPVHDRLALEVMRGCVRGCRFCQAGMITRPVRERDAAGIVAAAREGLNASGHAEIGLLSLSTGDFSGLGETVAGIQDALAGTRTNLVLPSLRVDSVDEDLYERISREKPASFTFAPEAGSQRLRDVINKNITEDEIVGTASRALNSGVNTVKLYFMIGLPTETNEDLDELVALVGRVVAEAPRGGSQIHVSISPFAPKSHTPFQWAGQISRAEIDRRNNYLARPLRRMNVKVSLRDPETSFLEALLGLGDERLAPVVAGAWKRGARFDGWSELFRFDLWEEALAAVGIDPAPYLAERDPESPLPWDGVDLGVEKAFLQRDWRRSRKAGTIPDCRIEGPCYHCGPCVGDLQHVFSLLEGQNQRRMGPADPRERGGQPSGRVEAPDRADREGKPDRPRPGFDPRNADPADPGREDRKWVVWRQQAAAKCWYRMEFSKAGETVFLGHLDFQRQMQLALRRSGLPVAYSKGYHPHPLLKFGPPVPVGVVGLRECLDLALNHEHPGWDEELNRVLPEGLRVLGQAMVGSRTPVSIDQSVSRFDFRAVLPAPHEGGPDRETVAARVRGFNASETWPFTRKRPKGDLEFDARRMIHRGRVEVLDEAEDGATVLGFALLRSETGAIMPVVDFLAALLGEALPEPGHCLITRTGMFGLQNDGRWLSPLEEVDEINLRYWLSRHLAG
ncbi:MAG: TIGR03936 family radical SAM-associated protein [Candidatus Krumholzibacteriia bacterium]